MHFSLSHFVCVFVDEWRFLHSLVTFTLAIINFVSVWTHFRCVFAYTHPQCSTHFISINNATVAATTATISRTSQYQTSSLTYIMNEDAMIGGQFSTYLPLFFLAAIFVVRCWFTMMSVGLARIIPFFSLMFCSVARLIVTTCILYMGSSSE